MVKSVALTEGSVMELLEMIPDPDIPVVSIVELGIVRGVAVDETNKVTVTITPTYSGCPAMTVFKADIRELLIKNGAEDVEIKITHSPSWSTDWLSESTREKLRAYGIAPPESNSSDSVPLFSSSKQKIKCPHCGNTNSRLTSQFGSTPCKSLWYCDDCLQPFEYFKCY